ncbi:phospholipase A and acyltransferase 3-like isoform 1-T4 [Menidia menidia]
MAPDPEPGDLIEVYRGAYNHWAVYIGDGDVVHLVVPDGGGGGSSGSSGSSGSLLGFLPGLGGTKGLVRRESLRDVAGTDPWLVNNAMDRDEEPYPPEQIVKRALKRVGDRVRYHLVKFNCEHFAKELRYGVAESSQVKEVEKGNVLNALVEVQARALTRPFVRIFRN